MAVIDTSMDMPKYCWSSNDERFLYCERYETCKYRDIHTFDYVPDTCPLKSIDGLARAIEQFPFTYGYASDIERVINNYCDKENTDGK